MDDFEKLGAFYLGKLVNPKDGNLTETILSYDSKDLTTHAVCVGMTGSGKTGLGVTMLEEAGIDKIPSIVIDPKGDLGNLLLTFPSQSSSEFKPWIDPAEAERKGMDIDDYAESVAKTWRDGLLKWGEGSERIMKFKSSVDVVIYTPASKAGIPLSILSSFAAPSQEMMLDTNAVRDRVLSVTSSLLGLIGIHADPIKSREHILISNIFTYAWGMEKDLAISSLIQYIQKPPFHTIGALDIDTVFPPKERTELSISINNLLASPGFQAWMEGEPLDIQNLLFTKQGKPRFAILSIAHLSDAERMFFVTLFLNELISWMRRQPGTSSLRALLYMDEIFGFFPPVGMPPSKIPMLTLLKQARAFGLGIVLATQNPVDLDYKGLSNCGTWFIGKLQTERDKSRVLEGMKANAKGDMPAAMLEKMIAAIRNRVFMVRSVYEEKPRLIETRWSLSYLKGPLTLAQIARLTVHTSDETTKARKATASSAETQTTEKPIIPATLPEFFGRPAQLQKAFYKPLIMGIGKVHYVDAKNNIDAWQEISLLAPLDEDGSHVQWEKGDLIPDLRKQIDKEPLPGSTFSSLPGGISKKFATFQKTLAVHLYQSQPLTLYHAPSVGLFSKPEETEGEFRARLALLLKEKRDEAIAKLEAASVEKMRAAEARIAKTQEKMTETKQKALWRKINLGISFFTSLIGLLLGRKLTKGTLTQTGTTLRRAGKLTEGSQTANKTEDEVTLAQQRLAQQKQQLEEEKKEIAAKYDPDKVIVESTKIPPRKSDISIDKIALVWWPV